MTKKKQPTQWPTKPLKDLVKTPIVSSGGIIGWDDNKKYKPGKKNTG